MKIDAVDIKQNEASMEILSRLREAGGPLSVEEIFKGKTILSIRVIQSFLALNAMNLIEPVGDIDVNGQPSGIVISLTVPGRAFCLTELIPPELRVDVAI